jgi:hypothetical protein
MPHDSGENISQECAYLKYMNPIGFLTEGQFADYKSSDEIPPESDMANPFAYWLNEKIGYHRARHELSDLA